MAEKILSALYGGDVQINFYPNAHRYQLVGSKEWLTSVTAVTGLIDKSSILIRWAISLADTHLKAFLAERPDLIDKAELMAQIDEALKKHAAVKDEAASNGSLVHAWAESFAAAKLTGTPMPPIGEDLPDQVIAGINGFLDWVNEHSVKFVEAERIVYSQHENYVGIADAICEIDGEKYLIDYKTSKGIYDEMYLQVSAYHQAYMEETGECLKAAIVHFNKEDGHFSLIQIGQDDLKKDFRAFQGLLKTKTRLKERAKV